MKKFALATCIAALCAASVANAQQPDVEQANALGLGWTACSTLNPVGALNFAWGCENEATNACRTQRLMPTFVPHITDSRFAGSTTTIDVLIGSSATVGAWWNGLVAASCRNIAAVSTVGPISAAGTCFNGLYPPPPTHSTGPNQLVAANVGTNPAPNRIRITSPNSVFPTTTMTTGQRAYAMQLEMKTEGTLADCDPTVDPTPVCTDGCSAGACFVLNNVDLFMSVDGIPSTPDIIRYFSDGVSRNFATYNGGTGGNCPGATPSKPSTWGAVKALYR